MHDATAQAKDAFRSVLVLWQARLYTLWEKGNRSNAMIGLSELDKP